MGILRELFSRPIRRGNSLADAPLRAPPVQDVNTESPLPYERRNSPTGIEYEGKQYRTGQFIPGSVMFTHTGTRRRDERWTPKPPPDVQPTEYADDLDPNELDAWEAQIDMNPLDSTTHLVHADWLQERGHDEEAEFRRAMGEWIREAHGRSPVGAFHVHTDAVPDDFNYSIWRDHLPEWARDPNAPESVTDQFFGRTRTEPHLGYHPNPYWIHWRGRRNMEEGLRRAHRTRSSAPGPVPDVQPTE